MDLHLAFREFLANCQRQGLSQHTQRAYARDLQDFQAWRARAQPQSIDKAALSAWLGDLRRRKLAPATIKRRLACLRAAYGWLEEEEYELENPFHRFKASIRLPRSLPKALSRWELGILFKQMRAQAQSGDLSKLTLWLGLEILFATGIRVGELCGIRLRDIDQASGVIRVRGKGNRERLVYLVDQKTRALLGRYIGRLNGQGTSSSFLLRTGRGTPVKPDFIRRNLHRLVEQAGLDKRVTPHMFRHSAATHLLAAGVDMRYVQRLLGHSSISTTEIYTHVSDVDLQASLERANPRRKLGA